MAQKDKELDCVTMTLQDLDIDDISEITKYLPEITLSEILESHSIYKLSLIYAARGSHRKFMRKIALSGISVKNEEPVDQIKIRNDLTNALKLNDFDTIRKLLEDETNTFLLKSTSGSNLISSLLLCDCQPEFLEFVTKQQAHVNGYHHSPKNVLNCYDCHGMTPLVSAILAGNMACVQSLLKNGACVDIADTCFGIDRFEKETDKSNTEENRKLLYNKDMLYGQSKTALMYAVCIGNLECVKILLKFKPDLKKQCYKGMTALDYAAITSKLSCLQLLVKAPVEIDKCEKMGSSDGDTDSSGFSLSEDPYDFTAKKAKPLFDLKMNPISSTLKRRLYNDENNEAEETPESDNEGSENEETNSDTERTKIPMTFEFGQTSSSLESGMKVDKGKKCEENISITNKEMPVQPVFSIGIGSSLSKSVMRCSKSKTKSKNFKKGREASSHNVLLGTVKSNSDKHNNINVRSVAEASLSFAIIGRDMECLKFLLNHCGNLGCLNSQGKTPLMIAAELGYADFVQLLLKNWAGVDTPVSLGRKETALMIATQNGHTECVKLLLQYNANVEAANMCQDTALMYAAKNGRTECLRILLEHKANVDVTNIRKETPLMIAVSSGKDECAKLLLEFHARIDCKDWCHKHVLMHAAESGNANCVELILQALIKKKDCSALGPSNNNQVYTGNLNFNFGSNNSECGNRFKRSSIGAKLVNKGQNVKDFKPAETLTSLAEQSLPHSVKSGHLKCFSLILQHCRDYNQIENESKKTALMLAVEMGMVECVKLLLQNWVNVNFVDDENKNSAVVCATAAKKHECLRLLLEHGANPDEGYNESNQSALIIATCNGDTESLKLLMEHGAKISFQDDDEITAMMHALCHKDRKECLKILLNPGVKLDIVDLYSSSNLWRLIECPENLEFLLQEGKLIMSKEIDEQWMRDHDAPNFKSDENKLLCVQLLMEYGVFDWKWWCNYSNIAVTLFIALRAGATPGKLYYENELMSPMQYALLLQLEHIARYLVSNLYLTLDDYRLVSSDVTFRKKLQEKYSSKSDSHFVKQLYCNPWRLQTLSLLTISTSLFSNGCLSRNKQVDSLPIPEKFKTILRFKGTHSHLCLQQWKHIGKPPNDARDDILCPTKALYPPSQILVDCKETNCGLEGLDLRINDDYLQSESSSDYLQSESSSDDSDSS